MTWSQRLLLLGLVLGLLLSVAVVAVFAARAMQQSPFRPTVEPIRPWMTVPYIARSHHVPASVLYTALGLPPTQHDRRPLLAIARAQHRPVSAVIAAVQAAIVQYHPPTPTPAPNATEVKA
jgi:hypothetical protein